VINGCLLPAATMLIARPITERITKIRTEISSATVEVLQGMEDLQAFNAQDRWFGKIEEENRKAGQAQEQLNLVNAMGSGIYLLVVNLTLLGIMWFAIPMVNSLELSGVALAVLVMVASASFEATSNLPAAAANLNSSLASARRLFSIDGAAQGLVEPGHCEPDGQELKIENVSFSYTGDRPMILHEVNLDLKRSQRKALVGVSGAGKTSLLNLLLGFQSSYSGKILVDGCEIKNINQSNLHRIFGVVPQSIYIFDASLRENLLLAKSNASDEEICRALALVQLEDWVRNLPQGLDTWLGEHGMKMSAGERQRLAAARIVLQDSPMVLLDEPTANLDPINEKKLLENLFSLFQDKGVLLITHKLHLLEQMDEIILLDNSTIAERGSYATLMKMGGLFSRLAKLEDDQLILNEDNQ
jgi:ATP-binding cassette subfamily C protein CydC